jgi:hypothetical protein
VLEVRSGLERIPVTSDDIRKALLLGGLSCMPNHCASASRLSSRTGAGAGRLTRFEAENLKPWGESRQFLCPIMRTLICRHRLSATNRRDGGYLRTAAIFSLFL